MTTRRRTFLKRSAAASAVALAASAGLLAPRAVFGAWPKGAFDANSVDDAVNGLHGTASTASSGDIRIKAPDIAENGAVVPISVTTSIPDIESITILAANNPAPLASSFVLGAGAEGFVSTRIKMGKTSDVIAVVKADGQLHSASKEVKVTIGGCGG